MVANLDIDMIRADNPLNCLPNTTPVLQTTVSRPITSAFQTSSGLVALQNVVLLTESWSSLCFGDQKLCWRSAITPAAPCLQNLITMNLPPLHRVSTSLPSAKQSPFALCQKPDRLCGRKLMKSQGSTTSALAFGRSIRNTLMR